jgi:D-glycero-D-manno-heptose 1,7-bisphosphate phosphatase
MMRPAIFLDRDGVLNRPLVRAGKPYAPRTLCEFELYPEAEACVASLQRAGFLTIVATNQPDIGNGLVEAGLVAAMHERLAAWLPIEHIMVCPHAQQAGCACRKPRPGMLLEAAARFDVDLPASFMVGDRAGDVTAGKAAGCRTIFIDRSYGAEERPDAPDRTVTSLAEAVAAILAFSGDSHVH